MTTGEADLHDMEHELAQGRRLRHALEAEERATAHLAFDIVKRCMIWACGQLPPNPDCVREACPNRHASVVDEAQAAFMDLDKTRRAH